MTEIGIPELSSEQVEKLCTIAEEAARKYVLSKIPLKSISDLGTIIDVEGSKPITVNVDVEIVLSTTAKNHDVQKLARIATEKAFLAIELYLKEIACRSKK